MHTNKLLQLEEKVSRQWEWRLREIDKFKDIVFESETKIPEALYNDKESPVQLLYRIGIVFLYSHWEGFIKNTAKEYMKCFKGEKLKNVPQSIVVAHYIKIHNKYSKKCTAYECGKSVIENIDMNKEIKSDIEDLVSTESNLDSTVLSKISSFLNLGKEWFELREKYINNFVDCRNSIAHGEKRPVSKKEFEDYLEGIQDLLIRYKEKLLDFNRLNKGIYCIMILFGMICIKIV